MPKIKILPENLANQIAAGEVVERPASVVKEILENSLDAGAKRVSVDVELGGRRLIRVSDDGEGMTREDALLAFERHATSKISKADDLAAIHSLGFRGEALASIASVSRIELLTKTEADADATRVVIEGGRMEEVSDAGRARGTTLTVRDLFFNTPARRKFMRSESTENFHIASVVTHYALSRPDVSFELSSNGRQSINVSPAADIRERAFQIFGRNLLESLLPVSGYRSGVCKVEGFTSAPRERRSSKDSQYFFVNGRFVRDKVLASALTEGYRAVLPHGSHPVSVIFLELPYDEVDVNVHPAKTEVRFRRGDIVREVVADAVRSALSSGGVRTAPDIFSSRGRGKEESADDRMVPEQEVIRLVPDFRSSIGASDVNPPEVQIEDSDVFDPRVAGLIADPLEETTHENTIDRQLDPEPRSTGYRVMSPVDSAFKLTKSVEISDVSSRTIDTLGQLHNSFIIAVDEHGLLLIDQHVAHERILFDKFRRRESIKVIESQRLLMPEPIDLSPSQLIILEEVLGELEQMGFELGIMSGRSIVLKAVPADVPLDGARNLLLEILDRLDPDTRNSAHDSIRDDIAASLACRAAVKINMPLTQEKMRWMVDRLLVTSSPTTCPHGRPVILRLTMKDIERGFHRS